MITKSDFQAVNQELMAGARRRLGEPPTSEEMLAYTRGEMSPEEEASFRERLLCYPELVRTLTAPFPTEGAAPGDPDFLSDEELAKHWASLQTRMQGRSREGRVVPFWRAFGAIAAALAVALGALLWRAEWKLAQPRVVSDEQVLLPDGQRGQGEIATVLS